MKHTVRLPIQFGDLDALGHVNSGAFIRYMETARVELMAREPSSRAWYQVPFVVASVRCEYVEALREQGVVEVAVWTSRLGRNSWDFDYAVTSQGRLRARGRTTQVGFDHGSGRVEEPPERLRAVLEVCRDEPLVFRGD